MPKEKIILRSMKSFVDEIRQQAKKEVLDKIEKLILKHKYCKEYHNVLIEKNPPTYKDMSCLDVVLREVKAFSKTKKSSNNSSKKDCFDCFHYPTCDEYKIRHLKICDKFEYIKSIPS